VNLMLIVLFASIGVGLFGNRIGPHRERRLIVGIATALTVIYFIRPAYMT